MSLLDTRAGIDRIAHDPNLNKDFYEMEDEIERESFFDNTNMILVISGLPTVKPEKYAKFVKHMKKEFAKFDCDWDEQVVDFYMPIGTEACEIDHDEPPRGETLGLIFVELRDEHLATRIMKSLHGKPFHKSHRWSIVRWSDWLKAEQVSDEFQQPTFDDFQSSNSVRAWLEDPEGRDQFFVRYMDNQRHMTAINWGDHRRGGGVLENWDFSDPTSGNEVRGADGESTLTEDECSWSPLGSYLTSVHAGRGLKTWCQGSDKEWVRHQKFEHNGVDFFQWSPNEKFLFTFSSTDDDGIVQLWNADTGEKMRPFDGKFHTQANFYWPFYKWSHDDKYFAAIGASAWKKKGDPSQNNHIGIGHSDKISVYGSEDCRRLGGGSYAAQGIRSIDWSPGKNLLAYATKGDDNRPTNISILEVTESGQKELRVSSSHFQVHRAELIWHPKGHYLCAAIVKKKRKKKKKKTQSDDPASRIAGTDLTIFDCNKPDMPRQNISIGKELLKDIKWDPTEARICVLQQGDHSEFHLRIFDFSGQSIREILKPAPKYINVDSIFWSPAGRHLCLHHPKGERTFFDTVSLKDKKKQHDGAEQVLWDPSGRFVISTVLSDLQQDDFGATDNGWVMYNFQGDEVASYDYKGTGKAKMCLFQFSWRPRPASLISEEQKAEISKTLKSKYWKEFEKHDREIIRAKASKKMKDRLDKQSYWQNKMEDLQIIAEGYKKRRYMLRANEDYPDGRDSEDEDEFEYKEVMEEISISYKEEEISFQELESLI